MAVNRFCTQCGAALLPAARFCTGCGAPSGQPAQETSVSTGAVGAASVGWGAPPAAPGTITASDIVYLFGESFAEKDNWHTDGVTLESSGAKVQKRPLARTMALAALAQLARERWIDINITQLGLAIFKQDTPVIHRLRPDPWPLASLEGALLEVVDNRGDQFNSIGQALGRVVTGQHGTGALTVIVAAATRVEDPWWEVISKSRSHLVETGHFLLVDNPSAHGLGRLFNKKYRVQPEPGMIAATANQALVVRSWLEEFQMLDQKRWRLAVKHIDDTLKNLEDRDDDRERGMIKIGG
jgi:hypothetical protein